MPTTERKRLLSENFVAFLSPWNCHVLARMSVLTVEITCGLF